MNNFSIKNKLYKLILITLVPIIIFGFYKNGIIPYKKGYIRLIECIKPLIIIMISIIGTILGKSIYLKRHNLDIKKNLFSNLEPYMESIIFAMALPIKSSPMLILPITVLWSLVFSNFKYNRVAVFLIFTSLINCILKLNIYKNIYETSTPLNYNILDMFLGFNDGGICSTSIVLILFGALILCFNNLYKKNIIFGALSSYGILCVIPSIINSNYQNIFLNFLSGNTIFGIIYISPMLYCSSYTPKGQVLYGILVGVITYFLKPLLPYTCIFASILVVSFLNKIIDRIFILKSEI